MYCLLFLMSMLYSSVLRLAQKYGFCQDLSEFIVLGKRGDEVSLLLQAEHNAMKISRRTDPNFMMSLEQHSKLHQ